MNGAGMKFGIGTRVGYDGGVHEVVEWLFGRGSVEVVLQGPESISRVSLVALLSEARFRIIADDPGPAADDVEPAAVALGQLDAHQAAEVQALADHIREVTTGFRSASATTALPGEPKPEYDPTLPLATRYAAKALELGVDERTIRRKVKAYREHGEAGLISVWAQRGPSVDPRWSEAARQVMFEHTEESRVSKAAVIYHTEKRLEICFGKGTVPSPSRSAAYRELSWLNLNRGTFTASTKRIRDIADRPRRRYGKLRPTRPGEYVILDTTPLDVFALDPRTLKWVRVELTVAMDWYTRCVLGVRLTPYSTKAVDAAAVLYQVMRPPPASETWPEYAVWPCHGIPREVLIEADQIDRTGKPAATPALNPEAIVVDHGKIYLSEHLNSVCQRLGISIQPARIRKGSDKGPLERFFRTVREGLLQYLPGYKGPDLSARGLDVEGHAFFYVDQLDAIIREWVATVYHHRKHDSLFDPGMPTANITPAQMFSHGIARAGYLEVSRDPQLAYEFLAVEARTIQHYGVERGRLKYSGDVLAELAAMKSPYRGKFTDKWPIHVDPDDVSRVYIRHPHTREWHTLLWEHASEYPMPFADDALRYFRRIVRDDHGFVDDRLALDEMFTRWKLGIGRTPAERRMALRAARDDAALSRQVEDPAAVLNLPSVTAALAGHHQTLHPDHLYDSEAGDDDSPDELDGDYDGAVGYAVDEMEWT